MEQDRVAKLEAQYVALRDVVIQLFAGEASREADAESLFQRVSKHTDDLNYIAGQGTGKILSGEAIAFQEAVQAEVDRIVGSARGVAAML